MMSGTEKGLLFILSFLISLLLLLLTYFFRICGFGYEGTIWSNWTRSKGFRDRCFDTSRLQSYRFSKQFHMKFSCKMATVKWNIPQINKSELKMTVRWNISSFLRIQFSQWRQTLSSYCYGRARMSSHFGKFTPSKFLW